MLHTRARYALFVPWLFEDLAGLTGPAATRALRERERLLAGRLRDAGEAQVIGARVFPKPSSQPPSTVYWNALAVWGILRPRPDGRTVSRAQAHRLLSSGISATDDDGQPLVSFEPPFVHLPTRPENWREGKISLQLRSEEAVFLRNQLVQLRCNGGHELCLLARLVRTETAAPPDMWTDEVYALAGPERQPLARSRQAASLAGVGRAVYDALLEVMLETVDKLNPETRHRAHLDKVLERHGPIGASLDIAELENDIGNLPPKLRAVLVATQDWVRSKTADLTALLDIYAAAEARKGLRARLPRTPNGHARRLEWAKDSHALARPLHYRWEQVSTLLNDLAGAEE